MRFATRSVIESLESRRLLTAGNILVAAPNDNNPTEMDFITFSQANSVLSSFAVPSNVPGPHDFIIDSSGNLQWNSASSLVTRSPSGVYTVHQGPSDWRTLGRVGYGGLAEADGYIFGAKMYRLSQGENGPALVRFDPSNGYTYTQSTQNGSISHVALGMNGLIYATTDPAGQPSAGTVQIYNPQTFKMLKEIGLPATDDLCVTADAQGNMYVGTFSDGLYKLDPTGKILLHVNDNAADLDMSTDGKLLAFGSGQVTIYDTNLVAHGHVHPPTFTGTDNIAWATYQPPALGLKLVMTGVPTTGTAGAKLSNIIVKIEDTNGDLLTSDTTSVKLILNSGSFASGSATSLKFIGGIATFSNVKINVAGTYTVTAKDTTEALVGPTSANLVISSAAPTHLVFAAEPTSTAAGADISPPAVVYEEDQFGNIVRTDSSVVTLSVQSGPGGISGTSSVAFNNGAAIFNKISFDTQGTYTLIAKDGSLASIVSSSFDIGQTYRLVFAAGPTDSPAGKALNPSVVVYLMDKDGNIIRNNTSIVTLSVQSGPGTISGSSSVALNNGAAIFSNISFLTAGSYAITAKDGIFTPITSASFTVSAAAASKLVFTTLPAGAKHGISFTVKISVEDLYGNVLISQNTGTITLALATHPTGSTLAGTLTANLVKGVATFSNLSVNLAGTYSFQASDSFAIGAATSSAIAVS